MVDLLMLRVRVIVKVGGCECEENFVQVKLKPGKK